MRPYRLPNDPLPSSRINRGSSNNWVKQRVAGKFSLPLMGCRVLLPLCSRQAKWDYRYIPSQDHKRLWKDRSPRILTCPPVLRAYIFFQTSVIYAFAALSPISRKKIVRISAKAKLFQKYTDKTYSSLGAQHYISNSDLGFKFSYFYIRIFQFFLWNNAHSKTYRQARL